MTQTAKIVGYRAHVQQRGTKALLFIVTNGVVYGDGTCLTKLMRIAAAFWAAQS